MPYISPINVDFVTEMVEQLEEKEEAAILHKVNAVIDVDIDELWRALLYDRNQYKKGYEDGKKDRPKGKWIIKRGCEEVIVTCSNCGAKDHIPTTIDGRFYFNRNYCWDCGADMRGKE